MTFLFALFPSRMLYLVGGTFSTVAVVAAAELFQRVCGSRPEILDQKRSPDESVRGNIPNSHRRTSPFVFLIITRVYIMSVALHR